MVLKGKVNMDFIFLSAASSLSLLTIQRVCYVCLFRKNLLNWHEQAPWAALFFSVNQCSKPLMHAIYVNRTKDHLI